jgi:hypothetical protein
VAHGPVQAAKDWSENLDDHFRTTIRIRKKWETKIPSPGLGRLATRSRAMDSASVRRPGR